MTDRPDHTIHNDLSGAAREVVQAGQVSGGVHFHGPADAAPGPPRQLPADVRGFVNRADDLARLDILLPEEHATATAVCVIAGTAGVGKTSLAVHWAHRAAGSFPGGQLYVNLRGYDPGPPVTAAEALERFLRALGVRADEIPQDVESRAALYRSRLAGRKVLVVLDNAATTSQVRQLMPGVPGCLVLVTSRSRLSGLVARDGAVPLPLKLLSEDDAVELLSTMTSRHRSADDPRDLRELAKLCARLPLALRIAAERAISRPWTSMGELIADLRDESGLWAALTAEDDDESDAVRTVFAWSYRALPPDAGRLFRFLGLHPGPDFCTAAAAAIGDLRPVNTRRLLDTLVGAHLLEQLGPDRYQFHDLLRLYALDQARAEEPSETYREAVRRIVLWYLHSLRHTLAFLAPEAARLDIPAPVAGVRHDDYQSAHAWFEREERNLRTAVGFVGDLGMHDLTWLLAASLYPVYSNRNEVDQWLATSEVGLTAARQLNDRRAEALLLESLGKAHAQAVHLAEAIRYQTSALDIHSRLGDDIGLITSTNAIGLVHLRAHDLPAALARFDETARLADALDSPYWRGVAMNNSANAHLELENFHEAHELLNRALDIHQRLGQVAYEGDTLRGLSHAHRGLGRPAMAREYIEQALDLARAHSNVAWEAHWLVEHGHVLIAVDDLPGALTSFQHAAVLHRRLGDRSREAWAHDGTGTTYRLMGRPDDAADFHRLAVAVFRDTREGWPLALTLDHLAQAVPAEAEGHWRESERLLMAFSDPHASRLRREISTRLG